MFGGLFSKTDLDAELNSVELNCVGVVATGQVCGEAHAVEKRSHNSFYGLDAGEMGCASNRTSLSARQAELVLSVPDKLAVKFHSALPGMTAGALALANGMLPSAAKSETEAKTGRQSTSTVSSSWITALNERAAENNNQVP